MTRTIHFFVLFFVCVVLNSSSQAACGGGGYQPSKKKVEPAQQVSNGGSNTAEARFDGKRNSSEVLIRRLSLQEFDQIRPQLKLTDEQTQKIKDLEVDIKKKGDEAITQVRSYDGKQDFEARVVDILTADQLKVYQSTKVAHR